jgi:hypothetical protein
VIDIKLAVALGDVCAVLLPLQPDGGDSTEPVCATVCHPACFDVLGFHAGRALQELGCGGRGQLDLPRNAPLAIWSGGEDVGPPAGTADLKFCLPSGGSYVAGQLSFEEVVLDALPVVGAFDVEVVVGEEP